MEGNERRIRGRRGAGTIEQRGGAWWWRRSATDADGRRRTWREGPYITEAEARAAQAARAGHVPQVPVGRDITWSTWLDQWLAATMTELIVEGRQSYAASLRRSVEIHLAPRIGDVRIADTSAATWRGVWLDMLSAGLARKTVRNVRSAASLASKAAVADGVAATDYVAVAPLPRVQLADTPEPHNILAPEQAALLASLCLAGELGRWSLPTLVALDTGARRGEVLGLQWGDLDEQTRVLHIRRQVLEESSTPEPRLALPKGRRGRRVTLPPRTVEALTAHRRAKRGVGEGEMMFGECSRAGGPLPSPDAWSQAWRRQLRRDHPVIADITVHDLRHTHASLLLRAGVSPVVVAARLGHADVSTTMRVYAHAVPSDDGGAADAWTDLTEW